MYNNVMLDIETLATDERSAILSIAAVRFSFEEESLSETFYHTIDLSSYKGLNYTVDLNTIKWWLNRPEAEMAHIIDVAKSSENNLKEVLESLSQFFFRGDLVWAKSPSFDCNILDSWYKEFGLETPWRYSNERDVRTLIGIPKEELVVELIGNKHNPLDDCLHQIALCKEACNKIRC